MSDLCLTLGGIACDEKLDAYRENPSIDKNSSGKRVWRCAWNDRVSLCNYILTANTSSGYSTVGLAHSTAYPFWFASGINVTPVSALPDTDPTKQAWIDVTFTPLNFNPDSPSILREDRMSLASEAFPIPGKTLSFSGGGGVADGTQDFLITYLTYQVTLKNITTFDMDAIKNCLNKISSGTMTIKIGGNSTSYPGDQVLYSGIDQVNVGYTYTGSQRFDITHNFLISSMGLNKKYNPKSTATSIFERFENTTPPSYLTEDLSSLGV